jgi:arginyl-tRNA synthetase
LVTRVEIAGPGFINFWLAGDALSSQVREIIEAGPGYGRSTAGAGRPVNVEFVSANPTGPLHVGHGRGAALGDGIAALYEWAGHPVTREFYVNDAGLQIDKLVLSLWARLHGEQPPEGGYHKYVMRRRRGAEFPAALLDGEVAAAMPGSAIALMREEQRALLEWLRARFDVWTSEQSLYDDGKVGHGLEVLAARGLTYEKDGALAPRSSATTGSCPPKQDGTYAYLVPDIAYHVNKHERGFTYAVDVWGADHHGYIPRMRAVLKALGYADDFFDVALVQLVKVMKGGEEVKMSKRAGDYVTLRDLVDMVGIDAARYFFLMRRGDSPFNFDVDLATRQTDENPVFYVQMAHARMSGIFRVARLIRRASGQRGHERASRAGGRRAGQGAHGVSADGRARRARARTAPYLRLPRGSRADDPRLVPQVPGPGRARAGRARPPRARPCRAHRDRQRAFRAGPHRSRPDVMA